MSNDNSNNYSNLHSTFIDDNKRFMFNSLLSLFFYFSFMFVHVVYASPDPSPLVILTYYTSNFTHPYVEEYFTDKTDLNIYRYVGKSEVSAIFVWFNYSGYDEDGTLKPLKVVVDGELKGVEGVVTSRKVGKGEELHKYVLLKVYFYEGNGNKASVGDGEINISVLSGIRNVTISPDYALPGINIEKVNIFIINTSLALNVSPSNMSSLKKGEQYGYNISYTLSFTRNYIDYVAVRLPYSVVVGEMPTNTIVLCSDSMDSLPPCDDGEVYNFSLDTSKIDISDSFFNITLIFEGKIMGKRRYLPLQYYLDKIKPSADLVSSNLRNGSTYYSFNSLNLSFDLHDVFRCDVYLDGEYQFSRGGANCSSIHLNNLTQKDHNLLYKVYDYANNTEVYSFIYYLNKSIAYIAYDGKIYHNGEEIGRMIKKVENNSGFIVPESMRRRVVEIIEIWNKSNIYGAYLEGDNPLDEMTVYCNESEELDGNTFVCSDDINNTLIINTSGGEYIAPLSYSFLEPYQNEARISSVNGYDYVILPLNISNTDYLYGLFHVPLYNVSYDFHHHLPAGWSDFICEECSGYLEKVDDDVIVKLKLKKKGIVALPIYSYYIPDPVITLSQDDDSVYIHHKFKIYNRLNVNFTNVKVDLPPPYYSSYSFINSSSCTLVAPQYISVKAKEEKIIDVEYRCEGIITTHFSYTVLKQRNNNTHRYFSGRIQLVVPDSPLFANKHYSYLIDENNLKGFSTHFNLLSFVDDVSSPVSVKVKNGVLNITTFSSLSPAEHNIYIKYWYEDDSESSSDEKEEEKEKNKKDEVTNNQQVINGTRAKGSDRRGGQEIEKRKEEERKNENDSSHDYPTSGKHTHNKNKKYYDDKGINTSSTLTLNSGRSDSSMLHLGKRRRITGNVVGSVAGVLFSLPGYISLFLLSVLLSSFFWGKSFLMTIIRRMKLSRGWMTHFHTDPHTLRYKELKRIKDTL